MQIMHRMSENTVRMKLLSKSEINSDLLRSCCNVRDLSYGETGTNKCFHVTAPLIKWTLSQIMVRVPLVLVKYFSQELK